MKTALLLDTETTGLSPADGARTIEVAVQLYDLVNACPIASFSSLIRSETNEAEAINRIPVAALRDARDADSVWRTVSAIAASADVIVAHRAEFDRQFVPASLRDGKPWACSKFEIEWPLAKTGEHLVHLALAHGIGIVSAHRALTDVDILSRLLTRVAELGHSLPTLVERALRPKVRVRAMVSYDDREMAKAAGFQWDGASKLWTRTMFVDDVPKLSFQAAVVE